MSNTSSLYYKQSVVILDTTQSTSTNIGSLILYGGAGIEKNTNIGGSLNVTGHSTFVNSLTTGSILVTGSSFVLPVGDDNQRVSIQGGVRFNSSTSTFEGFDGTNWGSLGGVIDIDQDTYIKAPGTDDDYLTFVTNDVEHMRLNSQGQLIINSTGSFIVSGGNSSFYGSADFYSTASFVAITTGELKVTGSSVLVGAVSTGSLTAVTNGGAITFNEVDVTPNQGDISAQKYFVYAGTPSNVSITGFAFDNAKVSAFNALLYVKSDDELNPSEHAAYEIKGLQEGTSGEWVINSSFIGKNIGITFNITNTGQIQFSCTKTSNYIMRFRALTTDYSTA